MLFLWFVVAKTDSLHDEPSHTFNQMWDREPSPEVSTPSAIRLLEGSAPRVVQRGLDARHRGGGALPHSSQGAHRGHPDPGVRVAEGLGEPGHGGEGLWSHPSQTVGGLPADLDVDVPEGLAEGAQAEVGVGLDPGELEKWIKVAGKPVWDKWAADMEAKGQPGRKILDKALELLEKYK